LRRVPAPRMNLSPTLGRARLPPSRQPLGGRGSCQAGQPSGGRGSRRAVNPREGEAPAEPANLGRARLPPSRQTSGGRGSRRAVNPLGGRGSCQAGQPSGGRGSRRAAKPREGEAPAEPRVETNGCYCGVWVDLFHHGIHGIHGNTTERLSRCLRVPTVVVHERSRPWWGEAPAEPRDSAA